VPAAGTTAVPLPVSTPFTVAAALALPVPASTDAAATPIPLKLPATSDTSGEADFPAAGAVIAPGTVVQALFTNVFSSNLPALSRPVRLTQQRASLAAGTKSHVLEVQLTFTKTVVLTSQPSFIFLVPAALIPSGTAYYLAFYDSSNPGQGWVEPYEGPAQIRGATISFTGQSEATTFVAGVVYYFDVYVVSVDATPSPRPTPTATATPSPGPLGVVPGVVAFDAPGQTATLTASEANFAGTFSAVANSALISVQKTGATTFLVTAGSTPCSDCAVTVSDSAGATFTVPITITVTTGVIH
jgi:hypothetical protein